MIVRAAHRDHYPWLLTRVGYAPTSQFRAIEAVNDKGEIRAMAGYDLWSESSVWMHVAVEGAGGGRALIVPAFAYPFLEARKVVVFASVRGSNTRSRTLCEWLGFREVWRASDAVKVGEDLIVYEMRRAECRWLTPARRAA